MIKRLLTVVWFGVICSCGLYADLVHRYSFNGNCNDSVGTSHGTLINGTGLSSFSGGQLTLGNSGSQSSTGSAIDYVDLPNGTISSLGTQATFEAWVTWTTRSNWQRIFDFGTSNSGEDMSSGASNSPYIFVTPQNGSGVYFLGYRMGGSELGIGGPLFATATQHHVVMTWNEDTSSVVLYLDGVQVGTNSPHFTLASMTDNNNWLGRSQWPDPMFCGSYNEFRIWNHAMTSEEIQISYIKGPDSIQKDIVGIQQTNDVTQVEEGVQSDSILVSLKQQPTATVQIKVTQETSDLELNGGFAGDPVTLTFTASNWATAQLVHIAAVQDDTEEGDETVKLKFVVTSSDPDYDGNLVSPIDVIIVDYKVNPCPQGDINGDCQVTLADLGVFAQQWLNAPGCSGLNCGDLINEDGVNLDDLAVLSQSWLDEFGPVVINEFMAKNASSNPGVSQEAWEVFDENGNSVDWIELYNVSSQAVSLNGWFLTDDPNNLNKWAFPSTVTIAPKSFMLIYATGTNSVSGDYIHTNFSLDDIGDYLALVAPGGHIVSEYKDIDGKYPSQEVNISYGLFGYFTEHRYFYPATPGKANKNSAVGISPDTKFSVKRGFFSSPFDVTIAADDPSATIRYTLDGSTPTASNGTVFSSANPIHISKTTTLRAASFKTGWLPSNIDTQTYIFVADVITQSPNGEVPGAGWPASYAVNSHRMEYGMDPDVVNSTDYSGLVDDALLAIPTLSLVTDLKKLFDPAEGIYVNANYQTRADGDSWEQPCSLELVNPDGSEGFQIDCGMRIRGGASRRADNPKHAFRFFFRSQYGSGKLSYPLFGDEGVDQFDKVDLRTAANYSWSCFGDTNNFHNTFVRDEYSRLVQGLLGKPYTKGRYYHLYINGQYWGLYQTEERPDSRFAASYLGGSKDDYDVVKVDFLPNWDHPVIASDGNLEAYRRLYDAIIDGVGTISEYFSLQGMNTDGTRNPDYTRLLDVDNLIDYMLIEYYSSDSDGPGSRFVSTNNFFGLYNRVTPDGFKWIQHDGEHSFGVYESDDWNRRENMVTPFTTAGANFTYFNPHWLHEQLATNNSEYRLHFADRAQELFFNGGLLSANKVWQTVTSLSSQIDSAIIAESARWGDTNASPARTRAIWLEALQFMKNYIDGTSTVLSDSTANAHENWPMQLREIRVRDQFRSVGWFPSMDAPQYSQHGGNVASGYSLSITNADTSGTIYVATELVSEGAAVRAFVPSDDSLGTTWTTQSFTPGTGWTSGSITGVGFDNNNPAPYGSMIKTNVQSQMSGKQTSVFCRIPFTVSNPSDVASLKFQIKCDDGFVAYINGSEVCRSTNVTNTTPPNALAGNHTATTTFEEYDITNYKSQLTAGTNILAIHGINTSKTSSDLLILPKLVASVATTANSIAWYTTDGSDPRQVGGAVSSNAVTYTAPIALNKSTQVKSRFIIGTEWSALTKANFAIGPVKESLRVTELMYHPAEPNLAFVELQNIGTETINLNLVQLIKGITHTFGDVSVAAGGFVLLVKNKVEFQTAYTAIPTSVPVIQWTDGQLSNSGEIIQFVDAAGNVIQSFKYADWYSQTDGEGFSLTKLNPVTAALADWSQKTGWAPSTYAGGSPGVAEAPLATGSIVINEILAHSHDRLPDWIEFRNTTSSAISVGGWYLSDSASNVQMYQIPEGKVVPANGYLVLLEHKDNEYNADNFGSAFKLSENGETLYVNAAIGGVLTGYTLEQAFGASGTGDSFGRYQKSTGGIDFVLMSSPTSGDNYQGAANSYPMVGPVVINEIMYNPKTNGDAEYVELLNISSQPANLWFHDPATGETLSWRFVDEDESILLTLPANTTLAAGEKMLLIKNLAAFQSEYGSIPSGVKYAVWPAGSLSNGGEKIELQKPGDTDIAGVRYYIRVDRVNYDDTAPWPTSPDGTGKSLNRITPADYGNDVANWQAANPSAGI